MSPSSGVSLALAPLALLAGVGVGYLLGERDGRRAGHFGAYDAGRSEGLEEAGRSATLGSGWPRSRP